MKKKNKNKNYLNKKNYKNKNKYEKKIKKIFRNN